MQCLTRRVLSGSVPVKGTLQLCRTPNAARQHVQVRRQLVVGAGKLTEKRCEPCEASHDAMEQMGLSMIMDQETAEKYHAQASPSQAKHVPGW